MAVDSPGRPRIVAGAFLSIVQALYAQAQSQWLSMSNNNPCWEDHKRFGHFPQHTFAVQRSAFTIRSSRDHVPASTGERLWAKPGVFTLWSEFGKAIRSSGSSGWHRVPW